MAWRIKADPVDKGAYSQAGAPGLDPQEGGTCGRRSWLPQLSSHRHTCIMTHEYTGHTHAQNK